jgi:hypothetical protein
VLTANRRQISAAVKEQNMSPLQSIPDDLRVPLDRDLFLRNVIRELTGTLEEVLGSIEVSCFMSIVGQTLGEQIDHDYKQALGASTLTREQVAEVLVDLARRIREDFCVLEEDENKIVFGNRACPLGDQVLWHSPLFMITSNIFGVIVAENLGYAKVEMQETIAKGQHGCRVLVHLNPTPEAEAAEGREYLKAA